MSFSFNSDDFMLKNETARRLFHSYCETLPIIDYHCHLSPKEIYEDRRYNNLTEVWLGGQTEDGSYVGDHYKWRLMRSNAVPEKYVVGNNAPYKRFQKFAETLELSIGNPMYHWCHLELKKYFGITEPLTTETAPRIWKKTSSMLQSDPDLTVRGIIRKSHVAFVGTTDDPIDNLEWHEKLAAEDLGFMVCPSFRPDKAINIQRPDFTEYMEKLAASVNRSTFTSIEEVMDALSERLDYFISHGCRASDHGLDYIPFNECTIKKANEIFTRAMSGKSLTTDEIEKYQTTILSRLARLYAEKKIVMELHYSCARNVNVRRFVEEGPDTGFDIIAKNTCGRELAAFLSDADLMNKLPKTIIFSLDQSDFNLIGACMGAFQSDEIPSKVQLGAAWWFLDTRDGMEQQMRAFANLGILGNFIGMLTDSRSFLSYARHDYFRRIMCNLIGQWVEDGEYPENEAALKRIVEGISYYNAERYFAI